MLDSLINIILVVIAIVIFRNIVTKNSTESVAINRSPHNPAPIPVHNSNPNPISVSALIQRTPCVSCRRQTVFSQMINLSRGNQISQCNVCYGDVTDHLSNKSKRRECVICLEKRISTWTSCCGQPLHK